MPAPTTPPPIFLFPQTTELPANLPAPLLLAMLRDRGRRTFIAAPLPPGFVVMLQGAAKPVPMKGWAIVMTVDGASYQSVAVGLSEADAKIRVALLNTRKAATGFHSRN